MESGDLTRDSIHRYSQCIPHQEVPKGILAREKNTIDILPKINKWRIVERIPLMTRKEPFQLTNSDSPPNILKEKSVSGLRISTAKV